MPWVFHFRAFWGIATMVALAKALPNSRLLDHFGRYTLVYLALHQLVVLWLFRTWIGSLPIHPGWLATLANTMFVLILDLVLVGTSAVLLARYAPALIGRQTPAPPPFSPETTPRYPKQSPVGSFFS